jgi:hypothetical protein
MGRWRPTLLHKLMRAVEHRAFEVPVGLSVLSRYRTAELRLRRPAPPPLRFSDAPLYRALFARYPEARLEAVRLDDASAPAPVARRFVEEQARLMQQQQQQDGGGGRLGEAEAFRQVEARLRRQLEHAGDARAGRGTLLSQLQDEEEGVLSGALRQRRRREQQALAQQQRPVRGQQGQGQQPKQQPQKKAAGRPRR